MWFSLTFPVCSKFPDFSLTGKCLPIFPGFPVRVGTLTQGEYLGSLGQVPPRQVHPRGTPPGRYTPLGRYTSLGQVPPRQVHPRYTPGEVLPLGRYTPVGGYTPQVGTPPGRYTPPRYTPWEGTPVGRYTPLGRYTPGSYTPRQLHPHGQ